MKLFLRGLATSVWMAALWGCSSDASAPTPGVDGSTDAPRETATAADAKTDAISDAGACTLLKAYSSKNAVCNQCAQTHCCGEINGCLGDPKCDDDYVNCILACALLPDDAGDAGIKSCLDQCAKEQPQGKAEYDIAIGCAESQCASECK